MISSERIFRSTISSLISLPEMHPMPRQVPKSLKARRNCRSSSMYRFSLNNSPVNQTRISIFHLTPTFWKSIDSGHNGDEVSFTKLRDASIHQISGPALSVGEPVSRPQGHPQV